MSPNQFRIADLAADAARKHRIIPTVSPKEPESCARSGLSVKPWPPPQHACRGRSAGLGGIAFGGRLRGGDGIYRPYQSNLDL